MAFDCQTFVDLFGHGPVFLVQMGFMERAMLRQPLAFAHEPLSTVCNDSFVEFHTANTPSANCGLRARTVIVPRSSRYSLGSPRVHCILPSAIILFSILMWKFCCGLVVCQSSSQPNFGRSVNHSDVSVLYKRE